MSGVEVVQDDFLIEAFGTVTPPPDVSEIVARMVDAASRKASLSLSASEVRVLADLLEIL